MAYSTSDVFMIVEENNEGQKMITKADTLNCKDKLKRSNKEFEENILFKLVFIAANVLKIKDFKNSYKFKES